MGLARRRTWWLRCTLAGRPYSPDGCCFGCTVRGVSHLRQRPGDIWVLPLVAVMTIVVALPVKTYAFLTMNADDGCTAAPTRSAVARRNTAASLR